MQADALQVGDQAADGMHVIVGADIEMPRVADFLDGGEACEGGIELRLEDAGEFGRAILGDVDPDWPMCDWREGRGGAEALCQGFGGGGGGYLGSGCACLVDTLMSVFGVCLFAGCSACLECGPVDVGAGAATKMRQGWVSWTRSPRWPGPCD